MRLPGIEPRGEGRPAEELAREMHDAIVAVERAQAELDRERESEMAAGEKREPEPAAGGSRGRAGAGGARGGCGGRGGERVRARGREPAQAEIAEGRRERWWS